MAKTAKKRAPIKSKVKAATEAAPAAEKPILTTVETPEKIAALRPSEFGLIEHTTRRFNASIPAKYADELDNPDLWVNCANKMEMGCEVRCLADDLSFVAYGICTFVRGTTVMLKIISFHELDVVDPDEVGEEATDYMVKLCGPKKWCILKKSTGETVKDNMPTQLKAMQELDDLKKALRR